LDRYFILVEDRIPIFLYKNLTPTAPHWVIYSVAKYLKICIALNTIIKSNLLYNFF